MPHFEQTDLPPFRLGILAQKSDRAFELLKQGADYGFWRFRRTWIPELEYSGFPDYNFVDVSIQALAMSGRPEFPQLIETITKKPAAELWNFEGGVITAVLKYKVARERGLESVRTMFFSGGFFDELAAWKGTPEGASWDAWRAGIYFSKAEGRPLPTAPAVEPTAAIPR